MNIALKIYNFAIVACLYIGLTFCLACAQPAPKVIPPNAEKEVVLLNDENHLVPILHVDTVIRYANIGDADSLTFLQTLQKYATIEAVNLNTDWAKLNQGYLVLTFGDIDTLHQRLWIRKLNTLRNQNVKVIAVVAQHSNHLQTFQSAEFPLVLAPEKFKYYASFLAQAVMGGKSIQGVLSQSYGTKFIKGMGFQTQKNRLGYSDLAYIHFSPDALDSLDQIAKQAITQHATPGMNVLVVKNGEVVYEKAFGNYLYQRSSPAQNTSHLFDLASVTKVMATTPEVMHYIQEGKIHLNDKISTYLPEFKHKPAENVSIQEVLLHEAGFIPFIPFYKRLTAKDFSTDSSAAFPTKVAVNYYLRKNYFSQVMWPEMVNSPLKTRGKYVYSDISMYVMRAIIQKISGKDLPELLATHFYRSLGLQNTVFNPWKSHLISSVTPTEDDTYFRHQTLQGYVHDQGAAMAGGVSGHAGLFSTTNDMAIFYQMLLNGGVYGGQRYLDSALIQQFTQRFHASSRRGLGFDKRDIEPNLKYPSQYASAELYGHTGYTGTCIWADPKQNFIFIFLSNRVQPKVSSQLNKLKIRERMLDIVYRKLAQ